MEHMRIRAEIDLSAIRKNLKLMRDQLPAGVPITAVIKADGYGHGAVRLAQEMEEIPYVRGYAVATAEEACALADAGIKKPVLILGYVFPESWQELILRGVRLCLFDRKSAEDLSAEAVRLGKTAFVHLAVDTGMSRIGFQTEEAAVEEIRAIAALPGIDVEGMFTHFARADEEDLTKAKEQNRSFLDFAGQVRAAGVEVPLLHSANSAAIFRLPEAHLSFVRAGITLYGLQPSAYTEQVIRGLTPAMRVVSHISYVKTLPAGREISYGGTFRTERPMRIATIPAGYADGYPRTLSGKAEILVRGKRVPVTGRICMDQFMADVTDVPEAARGDEVVLLGKQGEEEIRAEELGNLSGRFNYELVCGFSARVPRVYC